jgi:hypothetical protein
VSTKLRIRSDDHVEYIERRAAQADEEEARSTVLAAQNARRWKAINDSLRTLVEIGAHADDPEFVRGKAAELIATLGTANAHRAHDPLPAKGDR